jgi:hypothetical protein
VLPGTHNFQQVLHVRDGRELADTMTKIEYMRAVSKNIEDAARSVCKCRAPGEQEQWIEIALHREPCRQV